MLESIACYELPQLKMNELQVLVASSTWIQDNEHSFPTSAESLNMRHLKLHHFMIDGY